MKCFKWIVFLLMSNSLIVFSQEKYIQHSVAKDETISGIAKKYNIKSSDIYELNPDARNGIKYNTVLLLPSKTKDKSVSPSKITNHFPEKSHEVLAKETLYGISKQYNATIEDLYKINPNLEKEGLKKGMMIRIPQKVSGDLVNTKELAKAIAIKISDVTANNIPKEETVVVPKKEVKVSIPLKEIKYEVLPKDSYYSIAKKYGISVADLQKANATPESNSLKVGQKIIVPVQSEPASIVIAKEKTVDENQKTTGAAKEVVAENRLVPEIEHKVLPKETKYGIAKQYGITIAELEQQNPNISKKVLVGSMLKIRSTKISETDPPVTIKPVVVKEDSSEIVGDNKENNVYDATFIDQLIATASENIGTRYRSGGTTKDGFDCSGLMCYTFENNNIKLPRSSNEMAGYGSKIDTASARKGDLIFFKTRGSRRINHVGMVVEVSDGEIKFIHSATHGGVIISSTKESYYERNFVQVNRVL